MYLLYTVYIYICSVHTCVYTVCYKCINISRTWPFYKSKGPFFSRQRNCRPTTSGSTFMAQGQDGSTWTNPRKDLGHPAGAPWSIGVWPRGCENLNAMPCEHKYGSAYLHICIYMPTNHWSMHPSTLHSRLHLHHKTLHYAAQHYKRYITSPCVQIRYVRYIARLYTLHYIACIHAYILFIHVDTHTHIYIYI